MTKWVKTALLVQEQRPEKRKTVSRIQLVTARRVMRIPRLTGRVQALMAWVSLWLMFPDQTPHSFTTNLHGRFLVVNLPTRKFRRPNKILWKILGLLLLLNHICVTD